MRLSLPGNDKLVKALIVAVLYTWGKYSFVVNFGGAGNGINPAEPAVEINISAALRTEWAQFQLRRLAANRTGPQLGGLIALIVVGRRRFGHIKPG